MKTQALQHDFVWRFLMSSLSNVPATGNQTLTVSDADLSLAVRVIELSEDGRWVCCGDSRGRLHLWSCDGIMYSGRGDDGFPSTTTQQKQQRTPHAATRDSRQQLLGLIPPSSCSAASNGTSNAVHGRETEEDEGRSTAGPFCTERAHFVLRLPQAEERQLFMSSNNRSSSRAISTSREQRHAFVSASAVAFYTVDGTNNNTSRRRTATSTSLSDTSSSTTTGTRATYLAVGLDDGDIALYTLTRCRHHQHDGSNNSIAENHEREASTTEWLWTLVRVLNSHSSSVATLRWVCHQSMWSSSSTSSSSPHAPPLLGVYLVSCDKSLDVIVWDSFRGGILDRTRPGRVDGDRMMRDRGSGSPLGDRSPTPRRLQSPMITAVCALMMRQDDDGGGCGGGGVMVDSPLLVRSSSSVRLYWMSLTAAVGGKWHRFGSVIPLHTSGGGGGEDAHAQRDEPQTFACNESTRSPSLLNGVVFPETVYPQFDSVIVSAKGTKDVSSSSPHQRPQQRIRLHALTTAPLIINKDKELNSSLEWVRSSPMVSIGYCEESHAVFLGLLRCSLDTLHQTTTIAPPMKSPARQGHLLSEWFAELSIPSCEDDERAHGGGGGGGAVGGGGGVWFENISIAFTSVTPVVVVACGDDAMQPKEETDDGATNIRARIVDAPLVADVTFVVCASLCAPAMHGKIMVVAGCMRVDSDAHVLHSRVDSCRRWVETSPWQQRSPPRSSFAPLQCSRWVNMWREDRREAVVAAVDGSEQEEEAQQSHISLVVVSCAADGAPSLVVRWSTW